jgi:outer membrane protein, heavy metal efflux system
LTLQRAIDQAMAANPAIAAARLHRAVAAAGLDVASERPNPEGNVELTRETPRQAYGVTWPFELGNKRGKRQAVAQAAIRSGEAELAATMAEVRADVRRAYADVLVAQARLGVLTDLRDLSRRVRDAAQARFDAGDAPRLYVLQAGLAVGAAENEAAATEGAARAATARLNALLGEPLDAVRRLSDPLFMDTTLTTSAALDLARASNSELRVLDRRLDEQRARVELAGAQRAPDVAPSAMLTHDAQPEFDYGWRAGVAIVLPVLTTHKAGVRVEQATLDQLVAARHAADARIAGDVMAAVVAADAGRAAYVRYRDVILPQAQQVEQLAEDSYRLGQTGIAALLQSLQAAGALRLRSIDAAAQYRDAQTDLERAIGAPLP